MNFSLRDLQQNSEAECWTRPRPRPTSCVCAYSVWASPNCTVCGRTPLAVENIIRTTEIDREVGAGVSSIRPCFSCCFERYTPRFFSSDSFLTWSYHFILPRSDSFSSLEAWWSSDLSCWGKLLTFRLKLLKQWLDPLDHENSQTIREPAIKLQRINDNLPAAQWNCR